MSHKLHREEFSGEFMRRAHRISGYQSTRIRTVRISERWRNSEVN